MALGGIVDYRQPERLASAFQTVNDLVLRNRQAENTVNQDVADKAVAAQGMSRFQAATAPDELTGAPSTPENVYKAATEANATFSASGGRHSQAASKQVMDYLEAKMKMQPPKKQMPPMFKEVAPEGSLAPNIVDKNGVQYEEQEYMDMGTGKHVPGSTHFVPHNPPSSLFGNSPSDPSKNIGGLTEEDPETGMLRIKRGKDNKPIPLTRKEIETIQQQESDNQRQAQARVDYHDHKIQTSQAQLALYKEMLAKDPENELYTSAYNNLVDEIAGMQTKRADSEKILKRSQSLLKELDIYDPNKAYPTGGPTQENPGRTSKGFASKKKPTQTAAK